MAKNYGKTWWGEQWLNSLSNIDYSNRLPRGSAYANRGAVTSININKNQILAKVQGTRVKPYNIEIVVPPFSENEIKNLIAALVQKPVIISKLLNRELDPEILSIAKEQGLKVFPKQWSDFKMDCSCPDWAVPCKHLAAVIYKVCAEIDNNPFLVFTLHCMDLVEELKKANIFIQNQEKEDIPFIKDILLPEKTPAKKTKKKANTINTIVESDINFRELNLSLLYPIDESLTQLLDDIPAFYQESGDFRAKYATYIRKAVRFAQRIIDGKSNINEFLLQKNTTKSKAKKEAVTSITEFNRHVHISALIDAENKVSFVLSDNSKLSTEETILLLSKIPVDYVADFQPSVVALRYVLLTTMNLIANGAIVPQIVQLKNKHFAIRWLPALLSKNVRAIVDKLQNALPAELLVFKENNEEIETDKASHLLSIFLTEIIPLFSETATYDVFLKLFFNNVSHPFSKPGEQSLPGGIQQWLQRYYLTQGKYKTEIVVEELPLNQFQIVLQLRETDKLMEKSFSLKEVFSLKKYDRQRFEILQSVTRLSPFIPGLEKHINNKCNEEIVLSISEFTPFLMQLIPVIQLLDIDILLPKSLQEIFRPKASIRVKQKAKTGKSFLRLDKMLDFDWQVAVGDELMDESEFRKLLQNSEGLLKFKSHYIYAKPEDLQKLFKHFASSKELSAFEILRSVLSGEYQGAKIALTDEVESLIQQLSKQEVIALPQNLCAELRPYQHRGYSWIYRNMQIGFGSVLADDMGLGKTLQVICMLLKYKEEGLFDKEKALVVAPTGLLTNWQAEIEKFAPSLRCKIYHGTTRSLEKKDEFDVLLTSYGIMRSDADMLKKMKWLALIIDEAQNIKNYDTAQSKAVKSIPAGTFIAMSGTPVENRLSELWSIMDFCNRGFLGNLKEFKDNFSIPIENQNDFSVAEKLKKVTSPFLMRRLKSDKSIISDLPDKIEMDTYCTLTKEQAGLYEKTLQKAMEAIEGIEATDQKSLFARQGLVLQMILALKQICNHPTQFLKNNILDASLSGKMELLFNRLESIIENNEKVLIFTQFTEMGNLLKHFITERFGGKPLYYHGGCNLKQRKEMVDAFQQNRADKIFILSLKAAGTGLNLTAAGHVIHYDLWWNPAVEAQATDRAYRIGQDKNVVVHRFITKATFEESINEMIQSKKKLADLTVSTGENWIGKLSNKELKDIFELK